MACYRAPMIAGAMMVLALAAPAADGNAVLTRRKGPVFGVGAAARLGLLIGDGRQVMQPVGFGAGLRLGVHALHLGPLRLGGTLTLGHTRFLQRNSLILDPDRPEPVHRYSSVSHTDFALGPSVQLVLGRVMLVAGIAPGLSISALVRPASFSELEDEGVSDVALMLRGDAGLAVPLRHNRGLVFGVAVQKHFSDTLVVARKDLDLPMAAPNAKPFDLVLDVNVGYQLWF